MDLFELKSIKENILNNKYFNINKDIHPKEKRIVLKSYKIIDPFDIKEYIARD